MKIKISATIGPASIEASVIKSLAEAGAVCFRLNASHADESFLRTAIINIRKNAPQAEILLDTTGPELRISGLEKPVVIETGQYFGIGVRGAVNTFCNEHLFSTDESFFKVAEEGMPLAIESGRITARIKTVAQGIIRLQMERGGLIRNGAHIDLPFVELPLPFISEKDERGLRLAAEYDLEWVAASFVKKSSEVHELRTLVRKFGSGAKIIAKIERYAAVENIREILSVSDAILVARGDLGVEIPWTELPAVQDYLVAAAIKAVKPVVVATEFLSSMVNNAFPTRAEITDIMHAIDSGVTGILLSDETAVGRFGVEAVQILRTAAENQRRPWLVHS